VAATRVAGLVSVDVRVVSKPVQAGASPYPKINPTWDSLPSRVDTPTATTLNRCVLTPARCCVKPSQVLC
jgi:hypothetical protein